MSDLSPTEAERARRRDRKRVTRMVVNGGNLRRQLESIRRQRQSQGPGADRATRTTRGHIPQPAPPRSPGQPRTS